jgi:N-acetylmuramic acid 6-phosphate etherase
MESFGFLRNGKENPAGRPLLPGGLFDITGRLFDITDDLNIKQKDRTPAELAAVMNEEDGNVVKAVKEGIPEIATAIEWATESLNRGGRIIYMGAGTSGRLGVLDAVECPPTFGVSPDLVVGLIAGGEGAFVKAVEGAEDSQTLGVQELKDLALNKNDIVIGLAASGRTPYVIHGLAYADSIGCKTVAIACNRQSDVGKAAQLAIEPVTGPEVLTGSTRLKAGTAQKMVLNMISTGSMVGFGKVYQNLMVDVQQTNEKLVVRAQNITMTATGCTREEAKAALSEADGHVKTAIVMILLSCGAKEAKTHLDAAGGHVRNAL